MGEYDRRSVLPEHVRNALRDGWEIVHRGVLVTCPIPSPALIPRLRLVCVAYESVLAFTFWTLHNRDKDFGYAQHLLWSKDDVEWDGACGHDPFQEGIAGEFDLTEEQLEEMAAATKEKNRVYQVQYGKNLRANADDEYREAQRRANAKRAPIQKEIYKVVKQSQKFRCNICDVDFRNPSDLAVHNRSPRHLRYVADGRSGYHCAPCGFFNKFKSNYNQHLTTKGHLAKSGN